MAASGGGATPMAARAAARVALVAGVVLLAIWGPWRVPTTEQPVTPVATPLGVRGQAVSVSEGEGEPDQAILDGYVVVVPLDTAAELWEASGAPAPGAQELPHWDLDVQPAAVEDAGGRLAAIDGGAFAFDVAPGDYLVCLARGHDPLALAGCAETVLTGDERLRLTSGEAGVEVGALD